MSFQKNTGAVRRYSKAMRFGAWLQSLPQRMTPPPFRLMQVGSAFWQSRALYVATRLDIAGVLGDDSLDAREISTRIHCDVDAVARLLRFLSALGIFEEAGARLFRNNKVSAHLRRDHPQCIRAMILMHNSETMSRPWYEQLEAGVREGSPPFVLTHGEALFDHLDHQPEFDRLFSEAMDSVEALTGDSFATDFDWAVWDGLSTSAVRAEPSRSPSCGAIPTWTRWSSIARRSSRRHSAIGPLTRCQGRSGYSSRPATY